MRAFNISVKGRDSPKVQVEADYEHSGQCGLQITAALGGVDLVIQELPPETHPPQFRGEFTLPVADMVAAQYLATKLRHLGFQAMPIPADKAVHQR